MTHHPQYQRIHKIFENHYGEPALMVRAPGRVNLIGEHTDYNMGFVLPGAVDKAIWLALRPRNDSFCRFYAADLRESFATPISPPTKSTQHWPNYLIGVYSEMAKDGYFPCGVDCVFGGDIPLGSGMSSSAALECGFAFALNELFGIGYDRMALAQLGQRVENNFVGVNCGIMDQVASVMGQDRRLIRLDCQDNSLEYIPFEDPGLLIVLCDTHVRRSLAASGGYNARRAQCETGVKILQSRIPEVQSLRDVPLEMLETFRSEVGLVTFERCKYVIRENERVLNACRALAQGDYASFGCCMNASHEGLRKEYEVSCPELDSLAKGAQSIPGVLGSRMMGAGFGGCTINLVQEAAITRFKEEMAEIYRRELHLSPLIHVCRLTGGTEAVA